MHDLGDVSNTPHHNLTRVRLISCPSSEYHFVGSGPRNRLIHVRLHRASAPLLDFYCEGGIIHVVMHRT